MKIQLPSILLAFLLALIFGAAGCLAQSVTPAQSATAAELLQEFKAAEYFFQQARVGEKLAALNDKSVVPAMLALLKSADRAERCNAGFVLARLGEERGLLAILAELQDRQPRPTRGESCSDCKTDYSPGQIQQDRYYAAHVLGKIGDARAVPALIETLQDEALNYQAASVLGRLGDARAIPALLAALEETAKNASGAQTDFRLWIGLGLIQLKHPAGLSTLAEYLEPQRPFTQRRYAIESLGEFGGTKALTLLLKALDDTDAEVRVNAAIGLGKTRNQSVVPVLQALLEDTNPAQGRARLSYEPPQFKWMTVAEAAAEALRQIEKRP